MVWHRQMIIAYLLSNNINLLRSSISLKFIQSDMKISWFRCVCVCVCTRWYSELCGGHVYPKQIAFSAMHVCVCANFGCIEWNEMNENTWNNNHNKNYRKRHTTSYILPSSSIPAARTCNYCYIIQFSIHMENHISENCLGSWLPFAGTIKKKCSARMCSTNPNKNTKLREIEREGERERGVWEKGV